MKKKSLGFKLITGGILAVVIPIVIIGFFSVSKASGSLELLAEEQAVNIAKNLADMTNLILHEELKISKQLSSAKTTVEVATKASLVGADGAATEINNLNEMLADSKKKVGEDYETIFITDQNGVVFADDHNGKFKGLSLAEREYFRIAKNGTENVSNPLKSKMSGTPVIPICAPILSKRGQFLGAVVSVLKIDMISEKINSVKLGETGYPFMVNQVGLVVTHPNEKHILNTNLAKVTEMKQIMQLMMDGETGVDSYAFEGIDKIAGFAPIKLTGWSIGVTQSADEFLAAAISIRNIILTVGIIFLTITILSVYFFAKGISTPIKAIVDGLSKGAEQVTSASEQVSESGQTLASGASEQASSLEEISSSLEQMSSMTRQNAENANQADGLSKEALQGAEKGAEAMARMSEAIDMIKASSDETAKIIKTIDEIAFQTNLLALNAAVEAARAGEAGKGFAVVAEEVRNLAQRSAEAAKDTSALIEGSQTNANNGVAVSKEVAEILHQIVEASGKVTSLVGEVTSASNEQAQGIEQINSGVGQLDQVTQSNAATAEESASAGEELSAQAVELSTMVEALVTVIDGDTTYNSSQSSMDRVQQPRSTELTKRSMPVVSLAKGKAESIIPLDNDDFADF